MAEQTRTFNFWHYADSLPDPVISIGPAVVSQAEGDSYKVPKDALSEREKDLTQAA